MNLFNQGLSLNELQEWALERGFDYNPELADQLEQHTHTLINEAYSYLEQECHFNTEEFKTFHTFMDLILSHVSYRMEHFSDIVDAHKLLALNDAILSKYPIGYKTGISHFSSAIDDNWMKYNVREYLHKLTTDPDRILRFFDHMVINGVIRIDCFMSWRHVQKYPEPVQIYMMTNACEHLSKQMHALKIDAATACYIYDSIEMLSSVYNKVSDKSEYKMYGCEIVACIAALDDFEKMYTSLATLAPQYVFNNLRPGLERLTKTLFNDSYETLRDIAKSLGMEKDKSYWQAAYLGKHDDSVTVNIPTLDINVTSA